MKTKNKDKKTRILDAAAEHFSSRPFHKVLLSDVAKEAAVGKGTLYLYFKNKDELYVSVLFREFTNLVDRLCSELAQGDMAADEQMTCIVRELVHHLYGNSSIVELLRGTMISCPISSEWTQKRLELRALIASVIQAGVDQGIFEDTIPQLSAQYVPGMIRSICLLPVEGVDAETVAVHASNFVLKSLRTVPCPK